MSKTVLSYCYLTHFDKIYFYIINFYIIKQWIERGLSCFRVNLLTFFCKPDHFINISNVYSIAITKRVIKITPKKFYEIDSWFKIPCGSPTISDVLLSTSIKTLSPSHPSTSYMDRQIGAYSIGPTTEGKLGCPN
jgi:hypothetical protein